MSFRFSTLAARSSGVPAFFAVTALGVASPAFPGSDPFQKMLTAPVSAPAGSQAEILRRATGYAALLGYGIRTKYVTRYDPVTMLGRAKEYEQTVWSVPLCDGKRPDERVAQLDIAEATGEIVGFTNDDLRRRLHGRRPPVGQPISREQAIQAALRFVHKLGLGTPGAAQARYMQLTLPATAAGSFWYVAWEGEGKPAPGHRVVVSLQAETGEVSLLRVLPALPDTAKPVGPRK